MRKLMLKRTVRDYQADAGLVVDGIEGPMTRAALIADERARRITGLCSFRGSLGLLVRLEGHRPVPYVPQAASGVTIGFGWDLRWQSAADLERIWGDVWFAADVAELATACGLSGDEARKWCERPLGRWYHSRDEAADRLAAQAEPYWLAAVREWSALAAAPARAQTALLSVVYSDWLAPLRAAREGAARSGWAGAAQALRADASPRRELEAQLLESAAG